MNHYPGTFLFLRTHIPNILTALRLAGTPFILWLVFHHALMPAFWGFFGICLTDWLDGFLARRWGATSRFGQILDPLADKFLLVSLYMVVAWEGFIPDWLAICVIGRDIVILAVGAGILLSRKNVLSLVPHTLGKVSTTLQMLFIGLVMVGGMPVPSVPEPGIQSFLMVSFLYAVALMTVLSGLTYAWMSMKAFYKS